MASPKPFALLVLGVWTILVGWTFAPLAVLAESVDDGRQVHAAASTASRHWAFVPPRRPPLPDVRDDTWVQSPLDRFVLARLEREG